jgi:hypothetical protein
MRRITFITLLVSWSGIAGCEQTSQPSSSTSQPANSPRPAAAQASQPAGGAQWACPEATHDFGSTWHGTNLRHAFEVKNVGSAPLTVIQAKASCGCSVAENLPPEIPPGGTGVIPFRLNTAGKSGPVLEHLTIKTNSAQQGDLVLNMRGTVKTVCEVEVLDDASWAGTIISPEALVQLKKHGALFGTIKADTKLRRVLRLRNNTGEPLTLTLASVDPPETPFKAELKQTVPGQEYELIVTAEPPYPAGQLYGSISFQTNISDQAFYQIAATAYIPSRIEVSPPKIIFDPTYSSQASRHLTILNNGRKALQIKSVASSNPLIKTTIMPAPGPVGRAFMLVVEVPGAEFRPPPYGDVVRIETDDPEFARIDLPVLPTWNKPPEPRPAGEPLQFTPGTISTTQPSAPTRRIQLGPPPAAN